MVFIFLLVFIMIVLGGKNHRSLSIFVRLTPFFYEIISKRVWRVDREQFRYSRGRRGASILLVLIDCVRFFYNGLPWGSITCISVNICPLDPVLVSKNIERCVASRSRVVSILAGASGGFNSARFVILCSFF